MSARRDGKNTANPAGSPKLRKVDGDGQERVWTIYQDAGDAARGMPWWRVRWGDSPRLGAHGLEVVEVVPLAALQEERAWSETLRLAGAKSETALEAAEKKAEDNWHWRRINMEQRDEERARAERAEKKAEEAEKRFQEIRDAANEVNGERDMHEAACKDALEKAEELEERVRKQKEKIVRLGTAWDRLREALERIEDNAPEELDLSHGDGGYEAGEIARSALAPPQGGEDGN